MLDDYLAKTNGRRTPERHAILDACYESKSLFSLQELGERLEKNSFHVSRATLYNNINFFVSLRLVMKHNIAGKVKYEPTHINSGHCRQICTMCGKVADINSQAISKSIMQLKLKRFRQDNFALFVYGICSSCQAKLTRNKTSKRNNRYE